MDCIHENQAARALNRLRLLLNFPAARPLTKTFDVPIIL